MIRILLLICILCGVEVVSAQELMDTPELPFIPPDWLAGLMIFVQSIPFIGPLMLEAMKWAGFAAAVLTALSAFLLGILRALEPMEKLQSVGPVVQKINEKIKWALPWVQYFSMFNVQVKK